MGLSPSKPPSLTENFPQDPAAVEAKIRFAFWKRRGHGGSFLCLGRYEFVAAYGCRARFVGGKRSDITPYTSSGHYIVGNDPCVVPYRGMLLTDLFLCERRLIPPHQSPTRQTACSFLPPEGKPSLHCANRANIILCCGLLLRSALIRRLRRHLPPQRGRLWCVTLSF